MARQILRVRKQQEKRDDGMKKPPPMNARGKAVKRVIPKYGSPDTLYVDNGRELL
jgi:hypothetical protein